MELGQKGQEDSPAPVSQVGWRQSLVTRVGGSLLLLTAVFLAILGIVLVWTARQAQREGVFVQQRKSAREAALLISSYIGSAVDELSLFETMQPLATLSGAGQKSALERLLIYRRTVFSQITLLDKNGVELVKVSDSHTFMPGELGNRAGSEAFAQAMQGKSYIGTVFVSPGSGLLSVEIAVPVKASQGDVAGVLAAEVKVVRLWQDVSRIEIGQTGYAYLVDMQGRFIAYQEPGEVLQRHGEDMRRMPPVADFVAGKLEETPPVYEYSGLNNQAVIGVSVPVPDTSWAAVVELPVQEAYASVERMQWYLVGLTALSVVVAAGVGFAISSRILQPIRRLTASTQRIGAGDLEAEVAIPPQMDEVGLLARAFRQMQGKLRGLYAGLERQVAERTAELREATADLVRHSGELERLNLDLRNTSQQAERRATQLTASAQVAHAASQVRDLGQLLPQVTHLISQAFGYYHVGIFIVDEAGRFAVLRAANSEGGQRMLARSHKLAVGKEGIVGYVTGTGQPRIALDVGADAVHFENPDLPQTRSEMALPLRVGERTFGALDVQSTQGAAFAEEDVAVLSTLADQIAIAIENARLFTQTQAALQEAEEAQRRYVRQEWEQLLTVLQSASHEYHVSGVPPVGDVPLPEIEQAIRQGRVVTVAGDSSLPAKAALAMPIKLRDQLIGVIDLHETDTERQWTEEDVALVTAVADQVALALENARLFEQTRQRAQREQLVSQITARMRAAPDIESVLRTTVHEIRRALGARHGVVRLGMEEQLQAASNAVGNTRPASSDHDRV